jgi:hypothetical protein
LQSGDNPGKLHRPAACGWVFDDPSVKGERHLRAHRIKQALDQRGCRIDACLIVQLAAALPSLTKHWSLCMQNPSFKWSKSVRPPVHSSVTSCAGLPMRHGHMLRLPV